MNLLIEEEDVETEEEFIISCERAAKVIIYTLRQPTFRKKYGKRRVRQAWA